MINIQNFNKQISTEKVLFFDLDGTLIDTDYANFISFQKAIQAVIKPNQQIEFNPNERFNRTILKREYPNLKKNEYNEIIHRKELYYSKHLPLTKPIDVVINILTTYCQSNVTVLVTNCRRERAIETLTQHNLIDLFTHRFYRNPNCESLHINKFTEALNTLKFDTRNIIVFENEAFEENEAIMAGIPIENIITI